MQVRDFASTCMQRRPDHRVHALRQQARKAMAWQAMAQQAAGGGGGGVPSKPAEPLCIPVLALSTAYGGSGYDVVVPRAWGRAFWHRIVLMLGCKALGLQDVETLSTQLEQPLFPRDYVETAAGKADWLAKVEADRVQQLRRPAAKRRPPLPTEAPWLEPGAPLFVVMRNADYLEALRVRGVGFHGAVLPPPVDPHGGPAALRRGKPLDQGGAIPWPGHEEEQVVAAAQGQDPAFAIKTMAFLLLEAVGQGVAEPLGCILLPNADDYRAWDAEGGKLSTTTMLAAGKGGERAVVGWVTAGAFSWSRARGVAMGLVHAEALQQQQRRAAGLVHAGAASVLIVRNPRSTRQFLVRYLLLCGS